jgi:hypothetical protein
MKKRTYFAALFLAMLVAGPTVAGDCACGPCDGYEPRGFLRRVCDRVRHRDDSSRACAQGKTHLDMGCTPCRAYTVFVFGSCCEFFEHPETFQGPISKCCNRWK